MQQTSQTCIQALLIMAYNVGRDHEQTGAMSLEEGRAVVAERLAALVAHADIGVLSQPAESLLSLPSKAS